MSDDRYANIGRASTKAVEECAELIHAIQKAERFGWDNFHPRTKEPNREQILREISDVERTVVELRLAIESGDVTP